MPRLSGPEPRVSSFRLRSKYPVSALDVDRHERPEADLGGSSNKRQFRAQSA